MYNIRPNLYIGFHGCDESVRDNLVNSPNTIEPSEKPYDWLGHGFYVWENNYQRAQQWAKDKYKRGEIKKPSVVGVVFLLNNCLDFTDSEHIENIVKYYDLMKEEFLVLGKSLPKNKNVKSDHHKDKLIRELDCAVIQFMHQRIEETIKLDIYLNGFSELKIIDTVRGLFTEGGPVFDGAGIQKKNHIQICIRNMNCIKGFFLPRKEVSFNKSGKAAVNKSTS